MWIKTTGSKEKFESLRELELLETLVHLSIAQIRGKGENRKKEFYDNLSPQQQSLLSFWVMYGHTCSGWLHFYLEGLSIGGYDPYLPAIKDGLKRINDQDMLRLVIESEKVYRQNKEVLTFVWEAIEKHKKLEPGKQEIFDKISQEFAEIDHTFFALLEKTIRKMESHIRANLQEFIIVTG